MLASEEGPTSGLPTAPEGPIDLDETGQLAKLSLRKRELGNEETAVGVQHFQIARGSALVSDVGQAPCVTRRRDEKLLLGAQLSRLLIPHECIGDLAERVLNRSLVGQQGLLMACLGELHLRTKPPSSKQWLRCAERRGPDDVGS